MEIGTAEVIIIRDLNILMDIAYNFNKNFLKIIYQQGY